MAELKRECLPVAFQSEIVANFVGPVLPGWHDFFLELEPEIETIYNVHKKLTKMYSKEDQSRWIFFPLQEEVFRIFTVLDPSDVRVVILGQDPYPGFSDGKPVACGLAFHPRSGFPPSLRNIATEVYRDMEADPPRKQVTIDLEDWLAQGVFLFNSALTFCGDHDKTLVDVWKPFTVKVIEYLSERYKQTVYMLWGSPAQKFMGRINFVGNLVLQASHPSPFSYADKRSATPFKECGHFKQANEFLIKHEREPIHWHLR